MKGAGAEGRGWRSLARFVGLGLKLRFLSRAAGEGERDDAKGRYGKNVSHLSEAGGARNLMVQGLILPRAERERTKGVTFEVPGGNRTRKQLERSTFNVHL